MLVLMAGSVARGLCVSALFLNFLLLVGRTGPVWAASEPGKWTVDVSSQALENNQQFLVFKKTLFNSSAIHLKVLSHSCPNVPVLLDISWYLRNSHCYNEIFSLEVRARPLVTPDLCWLPVAASGATNQSSSRSTFSLVAESWEDGPYVFILRVQDLSRNKDSKDPWTLQLQVSMEGPHGYISATEWPLMMFYMVMCIVYVLMAVLWLVLSACFWRDLLRIQFWIGGVIFLGMLEKAVYYAEFQSIRYDGLSVHGAVLFAEVLSAVKRTLARVLVIIASLGYGIVK
ncbi:transmembrane protein 87A [Nematolebias whitei]|uniref:transmembrane protein 87A n=1 Tax=Nematolebias whitei TaxID=451745 RepID=UPI00189BDC88|nr:transmembrane protein 87A [Nematolebias whitei]